MRSMRIARRFMANLSRCALLESIVLIVVIPFRVSALVLDEGAHLLRRRKEHRSPVTRHAGRHDDRLAAARAGMARIRLERAMGPPEIATPPAGHRNTADVTARP